MKKWLIIFVFCLPALGADRYYAPSATGSGDRSSCANAAALTGSLSLVAGDIGHGCAGTYTGIAAATLFTLSASGTSVNPITFAFDQGQAVIASPYWGTNVVGAINISGNFVVLDGGSVGHYLITNSSQSGTTATFSYTKTSGADITSGKLVSIAGTKNGAYKFNGMFTVATATSSQFTVTFASATVSSAAETGQASINNLVIENTLNGTAGGACIGGACTQQQASLGIALTGSNDTIKNVTLSHIFFHTEGETTAETDDQNTAIETEGSGNLITRNAIDNVYNGVSYSPANGSTGEEISWNTIQLCNHCITVASDTEGFSGVLLQFNDISSMFNWDTPTNRYHHNGVFEFTNGIIAGTTLNANFIHGMMSRDAVYGATHVTGWVFIEFCNPGLRMYNNILEADADAGGTPLNYPANGYITAGTNCGGATQGFYNNTILGHADSGNCYAGGSSGMDFRNNLVLECGNPLFNATASTPFTEDYNTWYYTLTSGDSWKNGAAGAGYPNLAAWRTACACDAHSQVQVDPKVSTNSPYTILSGSSAIGSGTNLTSLGIAALNVGAPQTFGAAGSSGSGSLSRSGSGVWDAGAYPFTAASGGIPFTQTNNCPATLTATSPCTITVFFQPSVVGPVTANLVVTSNASTSPNTAALSGIGAAAAAITLSPPVINFGNVPTGTTSVATPIVVSNSGGVSTTISSITVSSGFGQTNNCPGSLTSGASCTVNVTASPTVLGVVNGTLTIAASASGSPFLASLSMNGVAPAVSFSPTSIPFGNQATGTASAVQSLTLTNTGTSPLTFALTKVGTNPGDFQVSFGSGTGCTSPLTVNASCVISVAFVPTTTGARSAIVRSTDNATGSPHDVSITGTGIAAAPAVCLSNPSFDFGNQLVGSTSVAQTETITNCGTANLVISGTSVTGDYAKSTTCGTLASQATCTINITFTPTTTGTRTSTLSILSNAASSPDTATITGVGVTTGATVLPASINFGNQTVGIQSAGQTVTVTNTGSLSLVVNTPTVTGSNAGDFSFGGVCGTIAPNSNCVYSVAFTPGNAGARSATFNQTFGGGVATHTVALSGTGIAAVPLVVLVPTSINFGNVQQHTASAIQTIQLTNNGNANLNIASIAATGANAADMTVTSHCVSPLAAGTPCTVDVSCTPSTTAAESASVTFTTDAASSPDNVTLSCTGTAAPSPHIKTPLPTLTFPATTVGTTSGAQVATITNDGNANLVISLIAVGGANDYFQSNNCSTVVPGASCAITVNFHPIFAGTRTGSVVITSNAASSPDTVPLTGIGVAGTANVVLAVTNINFGNQTVGVQSSPVVFTLSNTGNVTATGISVTVTSGVVDYTVSDNCGGSIGAGGSCSAQVRFGPQQLCGQFSTVNPTQCISNVHQGTITVLSNTPSSPQTVALQGTAMQTPPAGPVKVSMGGHARVGGSIRINR